MFEIEASERLERPPEWAALQRDLFETMGDAADRFIDKDGEPYWPPKDYIGVDGFDDVTGGSTTGRWCT